MAAAPKGLQEPADFCFTFLSLYGDLRKMHGGIVSGIRTEGYSKCTIQDMGVYLSQEKDFNYIMWFFLYFC